MKRRIDAIAGTDNLSPEDRRRTMRAVKGKGTGLERQLFSMLAGMGLRGWRKNAAEVIGKPDVVFDERVALFVDGCFWHGCLRCRRPLPKANRGYWKRKISRNRSKAKEVTALLKGTGWEVIRIWEHDLRNPEARQRIRRRLRIAVKGIRMTTKPSALEQRYNQVLDRWIESCTRKGKVSRNTVAIGVVVLDHLRKHCPVDRAEVVSAGGEIKGARSGLSSTLAGCGIPRSYLKEVTTRQAHQDGQRLLRGLKWGKELCQLPQQDRDHLLLHLEGKLASHAATWLSHQNLKPELDRREAPGTWVRIIMEDAQDRSGGVVEQHLVGAKLERRFQGATIPNHPAHAGDAQTAREGDFTVSNLVYHVTATPSRSVIEKCRGNVASGKHPILLVPSSQEIKARALAEDVGIDTQLTIASIESFVGLNIIELATGEKKDFFTVLREVVEIYNRRLREVETDLSLQIEVR